MLINRRANGKWSPGLSRGVKVLMGVLGALLVGGVAAGVAIPMVTSMKNAAYLSATTTMGKIISISVMESVVETNAK